MRECRVLPWRPRRPASLTSPIARPVRCGWTMVKDGRQIGCVFDDTAPMYRISWTVNRQWSFRSEFACAADAMAAALDKYDTLRASGWTLSRGAQEFGDPGAR